MCSERFYVTEIKTVRANDNGHGETTEETALCNSRCTLTRIPRSLFSSLPVAVMLLFLSVVRKHREPSERNNIIPMLLSLCPSFLSFFSFFSAVQWFIKSNLKDLPVCIISFSCPLPENFDLYRHLRLSTPEMFLQNLWEDVFLRISGCFGFYVQCHRNFIVDKMVWFNRGLRDKILKGGKNVGTTNRSINFT